jgi:hypothetical protein
MMRVESINMINTLADVIDIQGLINQMTVAGES